MTGRFAKETHMLPTVGALAVVAVVVVEFETNSPTVVGTPAKGLIRALILKMTRVATLKASASATARSASGTTGLQSHGFSKMKIFLSRGKMQLRP